MVKRITVLLILFILLPTTVIPLSPKIDESAEEYQLKAVWVGKFPDFIDWPEECGINDRTKPFIIKVMGKNPFDTKYKGKRIDWLREIYKEQLVRGKKVEIQYISALEEISGCHLLFISNSERKRLEEILEIAAKYPILILSDTEGFAKRGVYINIFIDRGSIRFEINETAIRESKLSRINPRLLGYATIVNPYRK